MTEQEYNERMANQKYNKLTVTKCTLTDNKDVVEPKEDYVFISYRSDSWKKVLSEMVYTLQDKYGLRIYFDKDFASNTNVWVDQFRINMNASKCKAFLCFMDEGYVTSYATLLEYMHAMNKKSKLEDKIVSVNFPIDWDKLNAKTYNTGLGVENQDNSSAKDEKDAFDLEFKLLCKKEKYDDMEQYYEQGQGTPFRACDCKDIFSILQPKMKHIYSEKDEFYIEILKPLYTITQGSVFKDPDKIKKLIHGETKYLVNFINEDKILISQKVDSGKTAERIQNPVKDGYNFVGWYNEDSEDETEWNFSTPIESDINLVARWDQIDKPIEKEIELDDCILVFTGYEKYSNPVKLKDFVEDKESKKFTKKMMSTVALQVKDHEDLSVEPVTSTADLVKSFMNKLIDIKGIEYIEHVNDLNKKLANPIFAFTEDIGKYGNISYQKVEKFPEYSMCTNYSQYAWIAFLKTRVEELKQSVSIEKLQLYKYRDALIRYSFNEKNCIVLKGSKVGEETPSFVGLSAKKLKNELVEQHIIEGNVFVQDYEGSLASLLNIICGGSVSSTVAKKKFVKQDEIH